MTDKQTVKFGDICKEVKLTTKDPIGDGYERYIGLEHLDSGSLKIKRWGMIAEDSPSFTRVFKKGQILLGKRRPYLKKAAIAEFDGICSGDIIVMEENCSEPLHEVARFIVQSDAFWEHAIKTSSGSLSPRTKYSSISQFEVTRITTEKITVLKELLVASLESVIKAEEVLESVDTLLNKLLIAEMVGDDKDSVKLGSFCNVKSGQHIEAKLYGNTPIGTPYLTGPDDFKSGKIEVTKYTQHPKAICAKGDTLLTVKGAGVGKTVVADDNYCISRQLMAIKSTLVSEFSVFLLVQAIAGKLNELSSGVIPGITKSEVENFPVKNIIDRKDNYERVFVGIFEEKLLIEERVNKCRKILNSLINSFLGV
ncbi:restriction endonuclease subunit S [Vibrio alginolyticus]|nr:restriction endonuclease subunit S [Vibrio parahaemolyticus]